MKIPRILALLCLISCLASGQENPGWIMQAMPTRQVTAPFPTGGSMNMGAFDVSGEDLSPNQASRSLANARPRASGGYSFQATMVVGNEADTITPQIQELADGLRNDPVKIYEYVYNYTSYECYYGSKKGAQLTLLERSGNDMDQAALLVALLRASGYSASYVHGPCGFPFYSYSAWWGFSPTPNGHISDQAISSKYGLTSPDAATLAKYRMLKAIQDNAYFGGYYNAWPANVGGALCISIPYTYVQFTYPTGGPTYNLSPAYKANTHTTGIDFVAASQYNRANFLTAAGGTTGSPDYVSGLSETGIGSLLGTYTNNLLAAFRAGTTHESSVQQLLGGWTIIKKSFSSLDDAVPITPDTTATWGSMDDPTDAIPTTQMSKLLITAGVTGTYNSATDTFSGTPLYNKEITMPSLQGKKLSLSFSGTGGSTATVHLDEDAVGPSFTVSGTDMQLRLKAEHGHYQLTPNTNATVWTAGELNYTDQSFTPKYVKGTANSYAFVYSFGNADGQLRSRQKQLDAYTQAGVADWRTDTENMNIMGLTYFREMREMEHACGPLYDCIPENMHAFGRAAHENGSYYIDLGLIRTIPIHYTMDDAVRNDFEGMTLLFGSAMEHGVIEQTQGANALAISTVRLLRAANAAGKKIYRATNANKATVLAALDAGTYSTTSKNSISTLLATTADVMLLPQSGTITVGTQTMGCYAYEGYDSWQMIIGSLNGGYNASGSDYSTGQAVTNYQSNPAAQLSMTSNFPNASYQPLATQGAYSVDPIEMASGAYVLDKSDLVLGSGGAPLGLAFVRQYHSNRNMDNSAGLGYGWTHNNNVSITERSAPEALMGGANSYQMAPFLAAAIAAKDLHTGQANAKTWATCALAVHWGLEQMKYTAVSVNIGTKTLQFIRMPDGSYIAPPGINIALTKNTQGNYVMTERLGNTWTFNSTLQLASITNPNGATEIFSYTAGKLATVTDAFSRALTFTWSGANISSVSDGTGSVSFGYTSGDMTSFTDPEGKVWTYHYNADHRMDSSKDPKGDTIAENDYDVAGRVATQRSMGDISRAWTYRYTDFANVETDPSGGVTQYLNDERGRNIGVIDPLGNSPVYVYDGQDRKYYTKTAKSERADYYFDADNNLDATEDERGYWTYYYYDTQFQPQYLVDKRGKLTSYTYTANHQLESVNDPLNHTTNYTYTDQGQLKTVTDGENKTTTMDYDTTGGVNKITASDNTFQSFKNNTRGDVLTSSDAENRTTTHTYNDRRQSLTTTLPQVPGQPAAVIANTYDDSGNLATSTDAKGNSTSLTYNALADPVKKTLPALATGDNVLTTGYDLRNWPTSVTDSLSQSATTEYDAAHHPTASVDALNRRTENLFDADGRSTQSTDPLSRVTQFAWNARGEKTRTTDPLTHYNESTLDGNGNQTMLRNRRAKNYIFAFDDANRLTSTTTPAAKLTSMSYFNNNQVKTITEPSTQATTLTYNGKNLVATKTDPTSTISYGYDNSGLLKTVTEGSAVISRTYDERRRLISYTNADGELLQYQYDSNNNLTRLTYPPDTAFPAGRQVNYTYNARNQLETVIDWSNRVTTYQHDRLGRLTGTIRPNGTSNQIAHDAAGQLLSIKESANGKLFSYLNFQYDAAGQITKRFRAPLVNTGWKQPTFAATYDDDNRLATVNSNDTNQTVTIDLDGNMTYGTVSRNVGVSPTWINLTYNSRNQLTNADGITYTYDAEGIRRTQTDSTGTTRDVSAPGGQLLIRHHGDGTRTFYIYGLGLLYEANEADATKTYHFDQVGSTIARTDGTGKVIGEMAYSPYGLITWKHGDMATLFQYNGQAGVQTDANGLLNMRARYYSPYLMRFLNADPSGFSGGSNWFAYADGNPISLSDPFGLCADGGGSMWENVKDGIGDFITDTLDGWGKQDRQIEAGAAKYDNWYNQQSSFVQNAELANYVGIPPAYITDFSDHKGEVLVMGTIGLLTDGLIRGGPLAEASSANSSGMGLTNQTRITSIGNGRIGFVTQSGQVIERELGLGAGQMSSHLDMAAELGIDTATAQGFTIGQRASGSIFLRASGEFGGDVSLIKGSLAKFYKFGTKPIE